MRLLRGFGPRFTAIAAFLSLISVSALQPTRVWAAWQQDQFVIGTFGDPIPDLRAYQLAAAAGINTISGYPLTAGTSLAYASQAGLKVLLTNAEWTRGASTPHPWGHPFPPNPQQILNAYASLPPEENDALWGYMLGDEPEHNATNGQYISSWAGAMHENDVTRNDGHDRAVYVNLIQNTFGPPNDWQQEITTLLNSYPANAQVDVASVDIYPWRTSGGVRVWGGLPYFERMRQLRAVMGPRPFWVHSWLACDPSCGAGPIAVSDAASLRFEGFAPAAAGAKGVFWFVYRNWAGELFQQSAVWFDVFSTPKAQEITPINMYLRSVVGPAAMSGTHEGIFFQNPWSWDANGGIDVNDPNLTNCPVSDLGADNLAVGVFRAQPGQDDYYLLIVNLDLTPKSSTVTLRHSYSISRAPSVVGYIGGNTYADAGTGNSFNISLAGGEGRMFRVSGPRNDLFALSTPPAGEAWLVGQAKTVSWQGGGPVTVTLYPDGQNVDLPLTATPTVTLGSDLTGGSASLTMPAGVYSRRAQLVVTSSSPGNTPLLVNTGGAFRTTPAPTTPRTYAPLERAYGVLQGAIALGPDGSAHFGRMTADGPTGIRTLLSDFDGSNWNSELPPPLTFFPYPGSFKFVMDAHNRPHFLYATKPVDQVAGEIRHQYRHTIEPGWNMWYDFVAGSVNDVRDGWDIAAVPNASGDVVVAFREAGPAGNVRVRRGNITPGSGAISWTNLPSPTGLAEPRSFSVAVDANGIVWLACISTGATSPMLNVYRITSTTAQIKLLYIGEYRLVSMTMDAAGNPHIAFTSGSDDLTSDNVLYRSYNGTAWNPVKVVDLTPKVVTSISVALQSGEPRIAYAGNGVVKLASPVGNSWQFEPIGHRQAEGPVTLRCASDGKMWISLRDVEVDQLVVFGPELEGGGGPECPPCDPVCDPCPILPAITVDNSNPIVKGGQITLGIRATHAGRLEMSLFDVSGRKVAEAPTRWVVPGERQVHWKPGDLDPGMYFLRARLEGEKEVQRQLVWVR